MKSVYKYILLVVTLAFLVMWITRDDKRPSFLEYKTERKIQSVSEPTDNDKEDEEALFRRGILQGVGAIQIEQAMAERRLLPLKPKINDPDSPLAPMQRILIVSTWRTGSSFLGDLIHSSPGVFYSYEPLHFIDEKWKSQDSTNRSIHLIRSLFQCQFPDDYLAHVNGLGSSNSSQLFISRNRRLWEACQHHQPLCSQPEFARQICAHCPVQLMKVVRLRLEHARQLLDLFNDSLQVIYLVRDPRGTMASRANLTWCRDPPCSDVGVLCRQMHEDLQLLERLREQQPQRFYLLRFEDLSTNAEAETRKLLDFLAIKMTTTVKVFLQTHTKASKRINPDDPYSTSRLSQNIPSEWRKKLSAERISFINSQCSSVLKTLNYEP